MAGIWKLPVLFVCENNQFATEVPFALRRRQSRASAGRGGGLRHARRRGRRQRRAGGPRGRRRGGRAGPRRRRADAARVQDLPHPAARRGHGRLHLPHPRGGRGSGRRAARSRGCGDASSTTALATEAELDADRGRGRSRRSRRRSGSPRRARGPTRRRRRRTSTPSRAPRPADAAAAGADRARSPSCRRRSKPWPRRWRANPRIFVLGEGIGKRGGNFKTTAGLYDQYGPERLCDTPICERGFVGLACGAAMTGTRPGDRLHVRRLRPRRASARSSTRSPRCST